MRVGLYLNRRGISCFSCIDTKNRVEDLSLRDKPVEVYDVRLGIQSVPAGFPVLLPKRSRRCRKWYRNIPLCYLSCRIPSRP